jgi:hypothetical protein
VDIVVDINIAVIVDIRKSAFQFKTKRDNSIADQMDIQSGRTFGLSSLRRFNDTVLVECSPSSQRSSSWREKVNLVVLGEQEQLPQLRIGCNRDLTRPIFVLMWNILIQHQSQKSWEQPKTAEALKFLHHL